MAKNAQILTLGCARNEVDSDELAGRLSQAGWQISGANDESVDPAATDVVIVNTCGFIEAAKAESIDVLLSAAEEGIPVVAAGCMAERYGNELADQLPEVAAVLSFDDYESIDTKLDAIVRGEALPTHTPSDRRRLLPISPAERVADESKIPGIALPLAGRARLTAGPTAYVKIASGCDRRCAFCAIPQFRGSFVSRQPEQVLAEAAQLADQGVQEITLVSENSTSYGKDLGKPRELEAVLRGLAGIVPRIRVSYLQPAEVRPSLLATMAELPQVAAYYDLSFQHAAPQLLRRMRRFGGSTDFLAMVESIRAAEPDAGIRTNVILGFPGETEEDVNVLTSFLADAQLDAVGVFGYSDEDGTEAVGLDGHLPEDEVSARVNHVAQFVDDVVNERARARIGDQVRVLVESQEDGQSLGRAAHQGPEDGETTIVGLYPPGTFVDVEVTQSHGIDLIGRAI